MQKEQYVRCMEWTRRRIGQSAVQWMVRILTALTAVIYLGMAGVLWWERDDRLLRFLLVPAVGFLLVTVFRRCVNAVRPYEKYCFVPLLDKDTKGNSFPSRHVFSNIIIAAAVLTVYVPLGVLSGLCGVLLAVLRVITGVHFPRDVIAGAILAALCGWIGFWVI